jgi:hypothetical protein
MRCVRKDGMGWVLVWDCGLINSRCLNKFHPFDLLCLFKMWKLTKAQQYGRKDTSAPIFGGIIVFILNRQGGTSLHHVPYSKSKLDGPIYLRCKSYIRHFIPALPIRQTMPIKKAVARGNGNIILIQKLHVQNANNPWSPQCHTEADLLSSSRPP